MKNSLLSFTFACSVLSILDCDKIYKIFPSMRMDVIRLRSVALALALMLPGAAAWPAPSLALPPVPSPASSGGPSGAPAPTAAAAPPAGSGGAPYAAFDFARDRIAAFPARRRALIARLASASDAVSAATVRLDLATLYLAQLLLPEAHAALAPIAVDALPPAARARLKALRGALTIVAGGALGQDPAPAGGWRDQPFWAALDAVHAKDPAAIRRTLAAGVKGLGAYPRAYADLALPQFLQAAIETQQWTLAKNIAVGFDAYPTLKARPVYRYLLGRAAEGVKRPDKALEAFRAAAAGQGVYAMRARLAIVDLGFDKGLVNAEQARSLLHRVLKDWHGGPIELGALRRLARVDRRLSDWPDLLWTLGRIAARFPASPDAGPAHAQAESLIAAYYHLGAQGKLPLARWLRTHRRILPYFGGDKAFEDASEELAGRLLAAGMTGLAAQEYARIHDRLALVRAAGLWPVAEDRLTRLRLGEAEALIEGGQDAAARKILLPFAATPPGTPALARRAARLRARALAALGDVPGVAAIAIAQPQAADLRRLAKAAAARGAWKDEGARLQQMWKDYPKDFTQDDAIALLLAAYRAGDMGLARRAADALKSLGADTRARRLAASLVQPKPKPAPLRQSEADARLKGAADAIRRARGLGGTAAGGKASPGP